MLVVATQLMSTLNSTFVPYAFRPYWHPFAPDRALFQDNSQIETLSKKLDAAEKKINEYSQLIASLSADLKRYQDIICLGCKENVFRSTLATAPSTHTASNAVSTASSDSTIVASRSMQLSSVDVQSDQRSHIISPEHANNTMLTGPSHGPDSPQSAVTHLQLTTSPPVSSHSIDIFEPSPSTSETSTNPGTVPDRSDWSVEYNPEIKQSLRLTLDKTFTFPDSVFYAKFSRDGKYLAAGLLNGKTHIYDMITGSKSVLVKSSRPIFYTEAAVKLPEVLALRFSLDNRYIVTAGGEGEIDIWEIGRRRVCASFKHKHHVRAVDLSPNGRLLVSASYDNSVCVWNLRDGSRRKWHGSSRFSSVSFHPHGRYVASGDDNGIFWVWDARTGQLAARCKIGGPYNTYLRVMFAPDGKRVATGRGMNLSCWDFALLKHAHSGSHRVGDISDPIFEFTGPTGYILAICFSSDNRWIVSSTRSSYDNVRILDARSGNWVCTLKGHVTDVWTVDFSPVGHYIVSGSADGLIRLWRYETLG